MAFERWKAALVRGEEYDDEDGDAEVGARLAGIAAGVQVSWE